MTFSTPSYLVAIPCVIALICLILVILLLTRWRKVAPLAVLPLFVGLLAGGVFAPMMFMDRVIISDTKIEQTTGFWFDPTIKGFEFKDLKHIEISRNATRHGLADDLWSGHYVGGKVLKVDPGDLWATNESAIVKELSNRGIEVKR